MASANLLQSVLSLVTGPMSEQAAPFLGESQASIKSTIETLIPNLLGAIIQHSSTPNGAASLLNVLNSLPSHMQSTNLSGQLGGGQATQDLMQIGTSLLSRLFGPKANDLSSAVASVSGMRRQSAMSLLALVTPLVLGMIRNTAAANQSLHPAGLSSLLESQKGYLTGRLSDQFFSALGLGSVAAAIGNKGATLAGVGAANVAGRAAAVTEEAAKGSGGGLMRWLPFIIAALAVLLALGYCTKKNPDTENSSATTGSDIAASPPSAVTSTVQNATSSVFGADAIPLGAGIITSMLDGRPTVRVYFESGQTELSSDFSKEAKDILVYLKDNSQAKLSISGFSDPTGDKMLNEELAKKRATAVKDALVTAGVSADRISLDKPTDTTGTGANDQARRVEIRVAQ